MAKKPNKLFTLLSIFHTIVLISTQISAQKSPIFACDTKTNPNFAHYKFCDSSARVAERVDDLVKRLSLDEKVGLLVNKAKGVGSLGIPNYEWWGEALHGVAYSPSVVFGEVVPGATSFPQVVLTAASFNVTLFEAIGKAVSTEARAMHNVGLAGLTFWAPNVNIFRDPRWGRGQETPGEDPYLTSVYVSAYVRGLQQREDGDKDRLKIAACCKHYTAYDLESWKGIDRHHFNAVVTKQDLEDTYQPPFKSCVIEGNVASVMCSFNQVNGKPTCGDENLLKGVVRGEWKLNGYIVTDCDSIQVFHDDQHYGKTPEDAVAKALLAGVDLNCGDFYKNFTVKAVKTGLVNESVVDKALTNNLATLMRLGFFDGDPRDQCYGNLGPNDVCTKEHRELAREAARQGIVLLKNDAKTLPFSLDTIKSLAIIGPNANATGTMLGNYNGQPCEYISPLDGLSALPLTIYYTPGCDILCEEVEIEISTQIAAMADATILVVGDNTHDIQGEGRDRVDLTLPGMQENLIYRVALASKGPVILVVMSSGGLDVEFAKYDDIISSILWVGYPGQAGGAALADVIFGFYNPSGLLPTSWYPQSYAENVPMTNMNMRPDPKNGYPGRTYRFYTGPTVYKFGDGLSYSNFSVSFDEAPELVMIPLKENHICRFKKCKTINVDKQSCEPFKFPLKVKNEGPMSGSYTVLLIIDFPPVPKAPKEHLARFEKVFLEPNTETKVVFEIDRCEDLSVVDEFGNWKIVLGEHLVKVGNVMHYLNVRV